MSYQRLYRTMLAILRDSAAAEDCVQETFLRAFKSWSRWKQDGPAEAWLHRIAINVAVSHRRRERLREAVELVRRLGRPQAHYMTDTATTLDLVQALKRLPPRQAATIVLRHLHGYSNREIAAALGIPERTVGSRLLAAKAKLRSSLDDKSKKGIEYLTETERPI
jgi:RNA polymerase sigma-70 factor (ECF subfamily)